MRHSGYHPLKHRPLRQVFGWCTLEIILLNIVLLGIVFGWHSGYNPLKHRLLRRVFGWCTVDIIPLNIVLLG